MVTLKLPPHRPRLLHLCDLFLRKEVDGDELPAPHVTFLGILETVQLGDGSGFFGGGSGRFAGKVGLALGEQFDFGGDGFDCEGSSVGGIRRQLVEGLFGHSGKG